MPKSLLNLCLLGQMNFRREKLVLVVSNSSLVIIVNRIANIAYIHGAMIAMSMPLHVFRIARFKISAGGE